MMGRDLQRNYLPSRPADVPVNILDIGLIQRELGWTPTVDWATGLRSTMDWMTAA
jgi:UDP-glucose 4-epimerase